MIRHEEIKELEISWQLAEHVIEKDYVIGWMLWGFAQDPIIRNSWVFKGGTCLKKCFLETYRFSEDLDFTVLPGKPVEPTDILPLIIRVLSKVAEESGIEFDLDATRAKSRPKPLSTEGRIYYRGPRGARTPASIKLDLDGSEMIVRPPVLRPITHPYSDEVPGKTKIRTYAFEEVFAEKIRAMGERCRPRDLYDIINLFRRQDLRTEPKLISMILAEKCTNKGVDIPTFTALDSSPFKTELESEWANMLAHQLPVLPPIGDFWNELENLFEWLEERAMPAELEIIGAGRDENLSWKPPATIWNWSSETRVPLEAIRFAAINRLCIHLGYQGTVRLIEPYSLRRTNDGNLLLHALKVGSREHRSYRIDRVQSVKVSTRPFTPVYAIEFSQLGHMYAPQAEPRRFAYSRSSKKRHGLVYIFECSACGKEFKRVKNDGKMRPHKDRHGFDCYGGTGYLVDQRYE